MIASTMAEFGHSVDSDALKTYSSQVLIELATFEQIASEHDLGVDLGTLRALAERFSAAPQQVDLALELDAECRNVLDHLGRTSS